MQTAISKSPLSNRPVNARRDFASLGGAELPDRDAEHAEPQDHDDKHRRPAQIGDQRRLDFGNAQRSQDERNWHRAPAGDDGARPLASLGYKQAVQLLCGEIDHKTALQATQQAHRNYAKRQMTWFRREPEVRWIEAFGDEPQTQRTVEGLLSTAVEDN